MRRLSPRAAAVITGLALAGTLALGSEGRAADSGWIGTWTASPQPVWTEDFPIPTGVLRNYWGKTVRQVARVSIGGTKSRIVLSNEFGEFPLKVGAASIALTDDEQRIKPGTSIPLTFSGNASITLPPGAPAISDPVDLDIPALSEVSISLFFPDTAPAETMHWDGHQTAYVVSGDQTAADTFDPESTQTARVYLSEIMVDAPEGARAIVTFGDSITDGDGSTVDGNDRWPDELAQRLVEAGGTPVAVQNQGISGAKVLSDRMGVNALARFERDVLDKPYADTVILMMGINDIGWPGTNLAPTETPTTTDALLAGYKQLIARAHADGLKIIGATLTPFGDAFAGTPFEGYYDADKEAMRQALNDFIRNSGEFDGVIDFDKAVEDPANPGHILPAFDKGDHLHPNPAGYEAMAKSIDLNLLAPAN
ncbi:MAG: SGNH/GDSL hydrolase family protein [Rhodobiaceae bacterium]|nr:SGNH/GDSL hydrolase family protein [Rhodobiaceae bacterium]